MAMATTSAPRPGSVRMRWSWAAMAAPASTGETEAASVAGRAASHQTAKALRAFGESREVGLSLLEVGVTAFLGLLTHVVQQRRVSGQLLDARQAVVGGVHPGLDHAQRERAVLEDPAGDRDRLLFQPGQWHDTVDQAHRQRLLGAVLLA